LSVAPSVGKGCGIGQLEVVGAESAELEVPTGVVGESELTRGQVELALQRACGGDRAPHRFHDARADVTPGGKTGSRSAVLVRDPRQVDEARSDRGIHHRDARCALAWVTS
jgi:hypothetical protein